MKTYTFSTYEPALGRTFIQERQFASEADFRLYCYALYSGNWSLISVR